MVSLTRNEAKVLDFLLRNFSRNYNINQIAREVKLSPRGAFKILKKFEGNKLLLSQKVGNNLLYRINFESDMAIDLCQFVLTEKETTPYVQAWIKDLQPLKELTEMAILFGSILTKEKKANDLDLVLVFPPGNLPRVQERIHKINQIKSKKIQAVVQTKEDLFKNIRKKDPVLLSAIQTGLVLWGRNILVEAIKYGQS